MIITVLKEQIIYLKVSNVREHLELIFVNFNHHNKILIT